MEAGSTTNKQHNDLKQQTEPHSNQENENVEIKVISNNAHQSRNVTDDPHSIHNVTDDQDGDDSSVHGTTNDEHQLTTQPVVDAHEGLNLDDGAVKNQRHEDKVSSVRPAVRTDHETEVKEQICMGQETNNIIYVINDDDDATHVDPCVDPFLTINNHKTARNHDIMTNPIQIPILHKQVYSARMVSIIGSF
eukprot:1079599_1